MDQVLPEELDFAAAQAAMQRRRLVAQQLAQQAATPMQGQMVSGHYIAPGKLNALAQLLSGLAAGKMEKDLDAKEQGLAGQRRAALEKGLAQYMDLRNGTPDQPMGPPTEEGQFGVQPGKKADPRAAAIRAVTSSMPELRQLGMLDLQGLGKQEQETFGQPVTERDSKTGELVAVQYGNRGGRRPVQGAVPYEKPIVAEGRVLDPAKPKDPLADYSITGGKLEIHNGDLYQRDSNNKLRKLDNAPRTSVSVGGPTVAMGQRKISESWAAKAVDTVNELAASARGSVKMLGTLNQLEASEKGGIQSGPLAPAGVWLAGLAKQMNVPVDTAKLANSQTFDAAAISAWQDLIAQAGGNRGVVKEEAARMAQMVPQLSQSPQGRKQITAFLRQAAQQAVNDAQIAQKELAEAMYADDPRMFTFGLSGAQIPRPDALPTAPAATSTSPAAKPVVRNW